MMEEIEYHGESICEHCGFSMMYEDEPLDFTLGEDTKVEHFQHVPEDLYENFFDHECEFTEHHEYDEPTVEAVEY